MPISIYLVTSGDKDNESVAWLCDENWRLPDQVAALEDWLVQTGSKLAKGEYVADIGFSPRDDAGGGGASMSPEMMRSMADLGMSLFLSEYR